jgi:hypothetical protein
MTVEPDVFQEKRHLGEAGERLWRWALAAGLVGLAASWVLAAVLPGGMRRLAFSYVVSYAFWLSLALGALFFVILHHLTHTGWSVVVRRLAEALAGTLPILALLLVPILVLGMSTLYRWSDPAVLAHDPALQAKTAYLNVPFFIARWVVYFAVWTGLARYFVSRSLLQDNSGDVELTQQMQRASAPAMVAFALTLTFASFDLLMSLDAHWFSTIFGVYYFSGAAVGFYALLPIVVFGLQRAGFLRRVVTVEHYHDMGKLLFAFIVFWAYIAFSQYMLIWYGNIPEETGWLLRRQTGGWGWIGVVLIFGHFLLPFVALLSRTPKRRPRVLVLLAAWMLLMHWVDVFWLAMPELARGRLSFSLLDLTVLVGVGGIVVAAAAFRLRRSSLVPERDPRLAESLVFENA